MSIVRLKDIADKMGVSVVTVSNALSGKKGVSETVRNEVIKTANKMGYDVSRYSGKKEEARIGVVVSTKYIEVGASFYWALYQQVAYVASKRNCFTMLETREDSTAGRNELPRVLLEKAVDGLIVIGSVKRSQLEKMLHVSNIPIVLLDFYEEGLQCDAVMSNNYIGMYRVTRYLLERGHREIAFVGSKNATNNIKERYFGYRRGLEEWGISIRDEWIIEDRDLQSGRMRVALPQNMPTAFVCNSDHSAGFLYNKLKEKGLSVPDDVSIASYDNYLFGHPFAEDLTTYDVDMRSMAGIAVDTLLKKRKHRDKRPRIRYIDGSIIERNSVKNLYKS